MIIVVKVSVIMPTYNYGHYIGRTLSSVLAQTFRDFEIILVDDGSTDNTQEIVQSFSDPRIRYFYQENQGACVARNFGIYKSRGDYFLFHDADDLIETDHLEEYLQVAVENPGSNIYGPAVKVRFENGLLKVLSVKGKCPGNDLLEHWLGHWAIPVHCILWPRINIDKVGAWDEKLYANQDGDYAMRALVAGIQFVFAENAPQASYLRHENESEQISSTINEKTALSKIKVLEKIEGLLTEKGALERKYKNALGEKYYEFSRLWLYAFPEISDACFWRFRELSGFRKPPGSFANWIMLLLFGLRRKEKISEFIGGYIPWRF